LRPRAPGLPRARARNDLSNGRPAPPRGQRTATPRHGAADLRPLPQRPSPSPDLPDVRERRGDRDLRRARPGGAEAPLRLQRELPRGGHLRHLRAVCGVIAATWFAIPLAGLTVLSTLLGGYFAFRV